MGLAVLFGALLLLASYNYAATQTPPAKPLYSFVAGGWANIESAANLTRNSNEGISLTTINCRYDSTTEIVDTIQPLYKRNKFLMLLFRFCHCQKIFDQRFTNIIQYFNHYRGICTTINCRYDSTSVKGINF